MQKPVEKPIKFKKNAATFGKTYPITHIEAVVDGNGKTLPDLLEQMQSTIPSTSGDVMSYTNSEGNTRYIASTDDPSGIVGGGGMTETTWQELKDLRDNLQLTPGSLYRITDYQCTTTQENTQSAGHQFDIVLLALSANKLAEEGWAMEHPTDVYDVTFSDGVTKKCYIYIFNENGFETFWVIDTDTLLGVTSSAEEFSLNKNNKTATTSDYESIDLVIEGLNYNYFQNSNLSAWKVWYCLDNDKSRFAWADDSVDEGSPAFITAIIRGEMLTLYRYSAGDLNNLFAWQGEDRPFQDYTASQTPSVGDTIYNEAGTDTGITVNSFTPAHQGTNLPNGRGVIYRLIDEFNNDCPYDFKNIQYVRKFTDGYYDAQGTDTWVYTFNAYDEDEHSYFDATLGKLYSNDENGARYMSNIKMFSVQQYSTVYSIMDGTAKQILNDVVFFDVVSSESSYTNFNVTLYEVARCTYTNFKNAIVLRQCDTALDFPPNSSIVNDNRQVVWEDIS